MDSLEIELHKKNAKLNRITKKIESLTSILLDDDPTPYINRDVVMLILHDIAYTIEEVIEEYNKLPPVYKNFILNKSIDLSYEIPCESQDSKWHYIAQAMGYTKKNQLWIL